MKYRRLGSTETPVSVVGIGLWQFGGEWGRDDDVPEVRAILDRARELGINLLASTPPSATPTTSPNG